MATIQNRSRLRIAVTNNAGLTREFSFNRLPAVEACMADLLQRGCKPRVEQLADSFEVRIRQRGYAPICITSGSEAEAANFVKRVEAERSRGLFVDYTKAHNITLAELLVRLPQPRTRSSGPGWNCTRRERLQRIRSCARPLPGSSVLQHFAHFAPEDGQDRVVVVPAAGKHHFHRPRRVHGDLAQKHALEMQA
jgi:hypothetical protein